MQLRDTYIFVTSVLFGATAVPYGVFAALVGWQPTHLAVWLGVATLLPLGPSLHGLLATAEAVLAEDAPSAAARTFVAAWWLSARELWWFWLGASALLVAMAYRLSLAWSSDPAVASVSVVGAGLVAGAVQLWFVLLPGADASTRGLLVDHDALCRELVSGRLSAYLDVTEPEPLQPGDPLYSLPNVLLTPHIAGAMGTELQRLGDAAVTEIERHVAGATPLHPVDSEALVLSA